MLKFSFSAFKNDNKKIIFAKAHPKDDEEEKIFMKKNTLFHEQETCMGIYSEDRILEDVFADWWSQNGNKTQKKYPSCQRKIGYLGVTCSYIGQNIQIE